MPKFAPRMITREARKRRISVTVEEIVDCLLILFVGRITVTHTSGNLFFSRSVTLLNGVTFAFDVISVDVFHSVM